MMSSVEMLADAIGRDKVLADIRVFRFVCSSGVSVRSGLNNVGNQIRDTCESEGKLAVPMGARVDGVIGGKRTVTAWAAFVYPPMGDRLETSCPRSNTGGAASGTH